MDADKKNLIQAMNERLKELQQGIDMHCCMISSIVEDDVDEEKLRMLREICPSRNRELMLKNAIRETIETLEETKKSFKSKQLEILRKKLLQVLIHAE